MGTQIQLLPAQRTPIDLPDLADVIGLSTYDTVIFVVTSDYVLYSYEHDSASWNQVCPFFVFFFFLRYQEYVIHIKYHSQHEQYV